MKTDAKDRLLNGLFLSGYSLQGDGSFRLVTKDKLRILVRVLDQHASITLKWDSGDMRQDTLSFAAATGLLSILQYWRSE